MSNAIVPAASLVTATFEMSGAPPPSPVASR
jgi:hypothetical protein